MANTIEQEIARLRQMLNPAIRGPNTNAILEAIATGGTLPLINNVEAVNDMLYIVTATGRYLDQLMADRDLSRPDNIGLSDEAFREIGIEVINRKQVRDLILNILRIAYGEEFTRASVDSSVIQPYALSDGGNLLLQFDDGETVEIFFHTSQFANIATATAQEVADAITRGLRQLGKTGNAVATDNGSGFFVQVFSETDGPSSSVKILGGSSQNKLKFPVIRPTTGISTTQWSIVVQPSGLTRATWSGGATPSVGVVQKNDYVNIFGSGFNANNRGTFTILTVQGGSVGQAYVEFDNPYGVTETQLQGTNEGILFFNPKRHTILNKGNYASAYQVDKGILEVFIPATTRVVRRDRVGSAHTYESGPSVGSDYGPYIFDPTKPYVIGGEEANTTQIVDSSSSRIITVDNSSTIPDSPGFLVFGFGTSKEEGPVPYIARPSNSTLLIDPSYKFKNSHSSGTNISYVVQNYAYVPASDGSDFPFYITDIVSGRLYAEELVNLVAATGIVVIITVLYPNPVGLENWKATDQTRKDTWQAVWGPDKV